MRTRLPGTVVKAYLSAARLPLDAAARIGGQQANEQWPPALAFEGLEANVETVVGSLLRDDALVESGRLRRAKVARLRKAGDIGAVADATRAEARDEFAKRREQTEKKRRDATKRAEARERKVEQQAQQSKASVERRAAKKVAAAEAAESAAEDVIERRERAAQADALAKEAEALEARQVALRTEETLDVIDDTLEGTREDRKSS